MGAYAERRDLNLATAGLGEQWEIDRVAVKPLPACYFSIAAIDAAMAIARETGLRASDIAAVRVLLPEAAIATVCEPSALRRRPVDPYTAIFSIYYGVACALVHGDYTLAHLDPAALADPAVLALAARVQYEVDPRTTFPRYFSGAVIVTTTDGRTIERREDVHRGSPERALTEAELIAKFMANAQRALDAEQARKIRATVLDLESLSSVKVLSALLSPP
jgi:2-methylcitrate dehydratase PrpD